MKNLLLYMTDFYGYNEAIMSELNKQGWNVTWYQDKVYLSNFERLLTKVYKSYKKRKYQNYFDKTIEDSRDKKFDLILIMFGGNFFLPAHIETLRKTYPDTKIVYYAWDSVKNFPLIEGLIQSSDYTFTFDDEDAKKYDIGFLPLFYTSNQWENKEYKFDVSTVMSFFVEKMEQLKAVTSKLPQGIKTSFYLKVRDKFYLGRVKRKDRAFYNEFVDCFKINPLRYEDCISLFNSSKAVIDCPLPNQNGLTMRTFEVLSLKRKLITTNRNIKKYDFYTPNNIFVVENNEQKIPQEFFETPFDDSFALDDKYSLANFVSTLINFEKDN